MAVLKRSKNGTWSTRIDLPTGAGGKRQQLRLHAKTKAELADLVAGTMARYYNRQPIARKMTMDALFDRWLAKKALEVEFRSIEGYRDQVRLYLKPWFGKRLVSQLTTQDIQVAIDAWQAAPRMDGKPGFRSPRTIGFPIAVLSSILRYAIALGLCHENVAAYVHRPKKQRRKPVAVDASQAISILKVLTPTLLFAPIWTAFAHGLRRGEIVGLRRSDAETTVGVLHIVQAISCRGKTVVTKEPKRAKSERDLPMSPVTVKLLEAHKEAQERRLKLIGIECSPDTPLFDDGEGAFWHPDSFGAAYARALRKADHEHLRLHGTRHSFASIALEEGVQLEVISDVLGHESKAFTAEFYTHVFPKTLGDAINRVSDALKGTFEQT
jgi:integrase